MCVEKLARATLSQSLTHADEHVAVGAALTACRPDSSVPGEGRSSDDGMSVAHIWRGERFSGAKADAMRVGVELDEPVKRIGYVSG